MRQAAEDAARAPIYRIEPTPGPTHQLQIGACQGWLEKRVTQSGWCAKESRDLSGHRSDGLLCADDFARYPAWPQEREAHSVPVAVVADLVASGDDRPRQRRVTLDALADAEKGRPGPVLIEYIEHPAGHFGFRPIVDGDGHGRTLLRCLPVGVYRWRKVCPVGTEEVAARPESPRREQEMIRYDG